MKFCKYYDKIFTIILCKNNRNFICYTNKIFCINYWYSSSFSVLHLDINLCLCSTLKMRYGILQRQKIHHNLIFTSRSDTVPHPAMVNMTHNTKNNRSHLILILFPPQNSMSQYNNVYTKKENETFSFLTMHL